MEKRIKYGWKSCFFFWLFFNCRVCWAMQIILGITCMKCFAMLGDEYEPKLQFHVVSVMRYAILILPCVPIGALPCRWQWLLRLPVFKLLLLLLFVFLFVLIVDIEEEIRSLQLDSAGGIRTNVVFILSILYWLICCCCCCLFIKICVIVLQSYIKCID